MHSPGFGFVCCNIQLPSTTISTNNKQVKSWCLQDFYIKTSELVLHRESEMGGLGFLSRSLALLLHTFLERAAYPQFRQSLYAEALYRKEVIGDVMFNVPRSPYYNADFFDTLHSLHKTMGVSLLRASVKQIYQEMLCNFLCSPATDICPQI